jgi:hypothetical protein
MQPNRRFVSSPVEPVIRFRFFGKARSDAGLFAFCFWGATNGVELLRARVEVLNRVQDDGTIRRNSLYCLKPKTPGHSELPGSFLDKRSHNLES